MMKSKKLSLKILVEMKTEKPTERIKVASVSFSNAEEASVMLPDTEVGNCHEAAVSMASCTICE